MARYFFHYWNAIGLEQDNEGLEMADVAAAHAKALNMANEIVKYWDELPPQTRQDSAFEIVDEAGHIVLFVPISEAKKGIHSR